MANNLLHIEACPLCGCERLVKIMTCTDRYATGEQFDVIECPECGMRLTQDVPDEKVIGRYYETPDYISHSDTHRGLMNTVYHLVRAHMLRRKAALVAHTTGLRHGTLLDVGTGTGYFPHTMRGMGWDVRAIEKSAQARQFAKEHLQLDVDSEDVLWQMSAGSFDAITLWHVLEHLQHLNETWDRLYELLKEDGVLIIAVPNHTSADAAHYGADWAAYDVPRHLWHFAPQVMKRMAEKHGFRLTEMHPMPFDAFYVSMLTEKQLGHKASFVHGMWTGAKAWVAALGNKEQSSSLIYVFEKKQG